MVPRRDRACLLEPGKQAGACGDQALAPPSEEPGDPVTSPRVPAGPACPGALPRTSFLCRKDTLRMTAIRVFSSPSLVPLLAAFMSWVIWAKAEGLVRDAGGGLGTPATTQGHWPGLHTRGARSLPPSRAPAAEAKGRAAPRPPGKGLTSSGGLPGITLLGQEDFLTQVLPLGVQLRTWCNTGEKP